MKHNLTNLFDLQKFHNNKKLQALIDETHSKYNKEIYEDDLINVNAAGDVNSRFRSGSVLEGKDDD